ncbi:MAG: metalloregulator ArsR/SmtB family transcription factor [Mobilicoccus sp.]|nr:metalloregulator ArsR/SmtB family transcription factor [Mobilicoccus sp.]
MSDSCDHGTALVRTAPSTLCCSFGVTPLDQRQADDLAPLFKALGDPVRLRMVSMIAAVDELCVCDITPAFDLSGPTISHHLKTLRTAGLIDGERRGTYVYYRVRPEALEALSSLLSPPD